MIATKLKRVAWLAAFVAALGVLRVLWSANAHASGLGKCDLANAELKASLQRAHAEVVRLSSETPQRDHTDPDTSSTFKLCKTSSTGWEILLESLMKGFLSDGLIPTGELLDTGAQFGEKACNLATAAPNRVVHAIDPSPKNVAKIQEKFGALPNLRVKAAGMGREVGKMKARDSSFNMPVGAEFDVLTLDSMFFDKGIDLAFAHLDVEGLELDVLHGAVETIAHSKPLFTAEVRVHKEPAFTTKLLGFIDSMEYDAYIIDEVCGYPHMDYRNLLCFPRTMMKKLEYSPTFNLAIATKAIFRVEASSIAELVLPCCKAGGECCPSGDVTDKQCCSERLTGKWLHNNERVTPPAMTNFRGARKWMLRTWTELNKRGT